MIRHTPGSSAHPRGQARQESLSRQQRILRGRLVIAGPKVMLQRHEYLGLGLFRHHAVVRGNVVLRIRVQPGIRVTRRPLTTPDVEPVVRVDFVVNHEVRNTPVPVQSIVTPRQHPRESPVVRSVGRCTEDLEPRRNRCAWRDSCPRGDPVHHRRYHQPPRCPVRDRRVDVRVNRVAVPVHLFFHACCARRGLGCRLPERPDEIHRNTAGVVA